jgi:hypothetical protein
MGVDGPVITAQSRRAIDTCFVVGIAVAKTHHFARRIRIESNNKNARELGHRYARLYGHRQTWHERPALVADETAVVPKVLVAHTTVLVLTAAPTASNRVGRQRAPPDAKDHQVAAGIEVGG